MRFSVGCVNESWNFVRTEHQRTANETENDWHGRSVFEWTEESNEIIKQKKNTHRKRIVLFFASIKITKNKSREKKLFGY